MDYSKSTVYKLQCEDGHYYIGSTVNQLHKRFYEHKQKAVLYPERRVYKHILANGGWEAVRMVLVESFECKNRQELIRQEDKHIRASKGDPMCLNTLCAVQTPEQKKEQNREYKLANADDIREKDKVYRDNHKPEQALREKTWVENNRDYVNERQRAWQANNRDHVNEG